MFGKRFAPLEVGNLLRCAALAWRDRLERTFASPPPFRPPARDTLEPIHLGSLQLQTLPLYLVYDEHAAYAFHITGENACTYIAPALVFLGSVIAALVYVMFNYFGSVFASMSFLLFFHSLFISTFFKFSFVILVLSDLYLYSSILFTHLHLPPILKLSLKFCLFLCLISSTHFCYGEIWRLRQH